MIRLKGYIFFYMERIHADYVEVINRNNKDYISMSLLIEKSSIGKDTIKITMIDYKKIITNEGIFVEAAMFEYGDIIFYKHYDIYDFMSNHIGHIYFVDVESVIY